jgi:ABC-type bacteriocin/lantibiotic exporter with double-glycine peptidase domain
MKQIQMPKGQQAYEYDCGAKVLHLVMAYYGNEMSYKNLLKISKRYKQYGLPVEEMIGMAKRNGFNVISETNYSLEKIKKHIDDGEPVIVLLQAWSGKDMAEKDWLETDECGHYSIITGFGDGKFYFNDPLSFRVAWLTEEEFENRWHSSEGDKYAMVILGDKGRMKEDFEHMD